MTFPLAESVVAALERHMAREDDIELIEAGQPASLHTDVDVVLILGAPRDLDPSYADGLVETVRR